MANSLVPIAPPAPPTVPFGDMVRLAQAIAKSRLFGIQTEDQALALMAIAQAEGRHPALAARDYHIISGTPSKKAEAMLRDFFMAGGKVEWHQLTDEVADATFSHPIGGSVRITWDSERVKKAGLANLHNKYPRQMKRSRVVSEGVRTVWPLATSGMYVPEEVVEFAPQAAAPADTRAELDAFAATTPAEITGEVLDAGAIEREARSAAARGTDVLREHLRGLSREARAVLNGKIGTRDAPGELLVLAMRTDDALRAAPPQEDGATDAFGLPPIGEPQPHSPAGEPIPQQPQEDRSDVGIATSAAPSLPAPAAGPRPAGEPEIADLLNRKPRRAHTDDMNDRVLAGIAAEERQSYRVKLPEHPTSADLTAFHTAITAMLDCGDPPAGILRDNRADLVRFEQMDAMRHNALMRRLEVR